jgi:hypothetical protein
MISACELLLATVLDLSEQMPVRPVCAYIDPGTGSLVLQIILGSALACLVALKMYWRQFKGFAGRLIGRRSRNTGGQKPDKTGAEADRPEGHSDV